MRRTRALLNGRTRFCQRSDFEVGGGILGSRIKHDCEILPRVVTNLSLNFADMENVAIIKKVIQTHIQLYKVALKWLSKAKEVDDLMQQTWEAMQDLKDKICALLDSENDGLRTYAVKYVEMLVLVNTARSADSEIPKNLRDDISLEKIPKDHIFLKAEKLEGEGNNAFQLLLGFMAHPAISSVNLMACMGSLTAISRQRPHFMYQVMQGFESLHANLPPTLAKSQVSSVRKTLKMQLLILLKHPASIDCHAQMTTLLTDLGATNSEVMKALPKFLEPIVKRKRDEDSDEKKIKRVKGLEEKIIDDLGGETPAPAKQPEKKPKVVEKSVIELTTEDLIPRLTVANVADLVLLSMVTLPDLMPAQFQATYTPIAAAGTEAQIHHVARLLGTQLVHAGYGVGQTQPAVVRLLNEASLLRLDSQRVTNLKQVQELIIKKDANLLDNFLDEMLSFQHDKSLEVKKTVINFIEEACIMVGKAILVPKLSHKDSEIPKNLRDDISLEKILKDASSS
ncbi:PREDICTED: symplekin-like [Priapulus caudatus]|uniref:Symplekin-like n=1 Tax=Priapulus caudatus TaxID=37621 RepID=A0ABM1F1I5_PRICU|nr:PREDICTED: symplekin-like [Priapulus caudatus]